MKTASGGWLLRPDAADNGQVLLYRGHLCGTGIWSMFLLILLPEKVICGNAPDFFRCGDFHWLMFSPQE